MADNGQQQDMAQWVPCQCQDLHHANQPCDNPATFCDWCAMDGCLNGGKGLVKKGKRAKRPRDDDERMSGSPWGMTNPFGFPGPFGF